jgi:hypothetical protein
VQLDRGQRAREVPDRSHGRSGVHVVEDQVPLAEGAPLGVLSGEPNRNALGKERPQRQRLGVSPFDPPV